MGKALELGAGLGTITAALIETATVGNTFHCIERAPSLARHLRSRFGRSAVVHEADFTEFDCDTFHLVHSHGVLEHYSDATIRRVINRFGDCNQVHYVPGVYPEPSYGDERLLPIEHWVAETSPSAWFTFNGGLDYCLVYLRGTR